MYGKTPLHEFSPGKFPNEIYQEREFIRQHLGMLRTMVSGGARVAKIREDVMDRPKVTTKSQYPNPNLEDSTHNLRSCLKIQMVHRVCLQLTSNKLYTKEKKMK